jgi:UDP-N-acetylglucosamine--N-acetylmuramyl-(pentapeptide) pyrophosphoryl-undecaprenol N-acetylglucosamine transferase
MADRDQQQRWPLLRVVVAGGGTGGHLFPGLAVASEFSRRNACSRILFVGAGRPFECEAVRRAGYPHRSVAVEGIKGRAGVDKLRAALKIPGALRHSAAILADLGADLVMGVGGYAAGPVALAAWLKGIPVVLCEQNVVFGITNRLLLPMAQRVYVSFEQTAAGFDPRKMRCTGNPVRRQILDAAAAGPAARPQRLTVMVVGGSQGAHAINLAVKEALPHLRCPAKVRFIHQTGRADREMVAAAYRQAGIAAEVKDFFHEMASRYARADVIVCRAGATTVAELTALGKAALLVPYPHAADNHQERNARVLLEQGAARMILERDLSGAILARLLDSWIAAPGRLGEMASGSRRLGRPEAANRIVDDCYQLLGNKACI